MEIYLVPERGWAEPTPHRIAALLAAIGMATMTIAPKISAHEQKGPMITHLATVGSDDFVIGSTIGPDGALYVADGNAGEVLRIDRHSGRISTYATGLPPKAFQNQTLADRSMLRSQAGRLTCSSRS